MSFSTFSGPVRTGTVKDGPTQNCGLVVLSRSYDTGVVTAGVGNVDVATGIILPRGSQIINIFADQIIVPGGSSTSTISVGTTSGGADLFAATATTAGGRFVSQTTATMLAYQTAAANADASIFVRYAVGAAAGVGRAVITVVYMQRLENGAQFPPSA